MFYDTEVTMNLESPTENMVDNLKRIFHNVEADEAELELDCDITTILCQNNALIASLPF